MLNLCEFTIKICSTSPIAVLSAAAVFNQEPAYGNILWEGTEPYHLAGMQRASVLLEEDLVSDGSKYYGFVYGACRYSVEEALLQYGLSTNYEEDLGNRNRCVTLETLASYLNCSLEIYSSEPIEGISEHFIITPNGIEMREKTYNYIEIYTGDFDSLADLNKAYGSHYTEADINDSGFIVKCDLWDMNHKEWHI